MRKFGVIFILFATVMFAQHPGSIAQLKSTVNLNDGYESKDETIKSIQFAPEKKKVGLAILYSVLLPGMGELYAEGFESGKYFTIAEAGLWITMGGMKYYSERQKDNYFKYAESYGGVTNMEAKSGDYSADIGNYLNISDFNNDMAKQGRFEKCTILPRTTGTGQAMTTGSRIESFGYLQRVGTITFVLLSVE
ncbi:MAG: hypothetical protein IPI12_00980 [Ignavibacteriales bacterium]|nr:hypothetical protein [Ignavibacteriales bacterium]